MKEGTLLTKLYRAFKKGQLEVTSHDFRHTKITDLVNSGMTTERVQKYVGHTKITTTLAYVKCKEQADIIEEMVQMNVSVS
jgi:integrase